MVIETVAATEVPDRFRRGLTRDDLNMFTGLVMRDHLYSGSMLLRLAGYPRCIGYDTVW